MMSTGSFGIRDGRAIVRDSLYKVSKTGDGFYTNTAGETSDVDSRDTVLALASDLLTVQKDTSLPLRANNGGLHCSLRLSRTFSHDCLSCRQPST